MAQTYFGSTVRAGSGTLTDTVDGGFMVLTQTTTVTTLADGSAVTSTLTLPLDSQILNFFIDCTTTPVVGGGSATTVPITIGTAAAGTQYLSATDVIAGGRAALTFTAAQLEAMRDALSTTLAFTVDPNGTISTTQGVYRCTVVYAQKV
jgi:hypothetical protein